MNAQPTRPGRPARRSRRLLRDVLVPARPRIAPEKPEESGSFRAPAPGHDDVVLLPPKKR